MTYNKIPISKNKFVIAGVITIKAGRLQNHGYDGLITLALRLYF